MGAIRGALRNEKTKDLEKRRKIMLLSAIGLVDFSIISLYQTGVIRHLPDPSFAIFDSDYVNGSEDAYLFGVPDGPVSATVYALNLVLASAGGSEKTGRSPLFDLALGATVAGNAAGAIVYLHSMIFKQKKVCLYCITGALINIASAALITPLVKTAIKKIFK